MRQFPLVPDGQPWDIEARVVVNNAISGRMNVTGTVTLTANAATTTLADTLIIPGSHILMTPTTANAKAEGIPYVPPATVTAGQATLQHTNSAVADRTYTYSVIGG